MPSVLSPISASAGSEERGDVWFHCGTVLSKFFIHRGQGDITVKQRSRQKEKKISAEALREFAKIRRIANKAVERAIEETKKAGIPDDMVYAK